MKAFFKTILGTTALLAAGSASAATFTVNQTLDLTQPKAIPGPGFQGWQGSPAFNGGFNVALAAGDVFDFTVDFLGAQTLTVANLSFIWAFSFSSGAPSAVTGTGQFSFLDANGNAFLTSNVKTDTEASVHFGQFFGSGDFTSGLPGSLTFSGVRYVGTLDAYGDSSVISRDYANPALYLTADSALVGGAVPEPASWALMIAGFGAVGAAARRRTKVRVTFA